ncbi:MAG: hypothetical protein GC204_04180 [Chloroflexi bacterium]|nr:hypothetical protein [Chloroflexota bacterium]
MTIPSSFYVLWMLAFLGFPIGGGLSQIVVGAVDNPLRALLAGLITGAVIGLAQFFVLSRVLPLDLRWILVTALGMALGLAISVALFGTETAGNPLLVRAAITGLVIGLAQWVVLREFVPLGGWWIPVMGIGWVIAWTITRAFGVDLSHNWSVFGSSGAIVFQLLTALVWRLLLA